MVYQIHCNNVECDTVLALSPETTASLGMPDGWLRLEFGHQFKRGSRPLVVDPDTVITVHFCSEKCLIEWLEGETLHPERSEAPRVSRAAN